LIFNRGAPVQAEEITISELENRNWAKGEENTPITEVRQWIRTCLMSEKDEKVFDTCLDHVASLLIEEALDFTQGNRSRAAKLLGMSRPTFHSKIDKYGIKIGTNSRE